MAWKFTARLLPLIFLISACQNFANRFASVEKVCGVPPAEGTHYLQLYSSQDNPLTQGDVIVTDIDGREHLDQGTEKGCLIVPHESASLVVRHRLLSEG